MTVNDIIADMDRIDYLRSQIRKGAVLEESELDDINSYLESYVIILGELSVKGA